MSDSLIWTGKIIEASEVDGYLAEIISALVLAIEAKDPYLRGHSLRVAMYAELLGARLNLDVFFMKALKIAGLLHDIGKIGIDEKILRKPSKLTNDEYSVIKIHPILSAKIITPIKFPWKDEWDIKNIVRSHHERPNGQGYPDRLDADKIVLGARILSVADAYEAMTAERPYRLPLSHENIINELRINSGKQFDSHIVDTMLILLGEGVNEGVDIAPTFR